MITVVVEEVFIEYISEGKLAEAKQLLEMFPALDINYKKENGTTALSAAAWRPEMEPLGFLLSRTDLDRSFLIARQEGVLITAILLGHMDKAKKLWAMFPQINVNYVTTGGETAISAATRHAEIEMMDLLLARDDIEINGLLPNGVTAAQAALRCNNTGGVIRLLKDPRFDPNVLNTGDETLVAYIVGFGQWKLCLHLIISDKELKPTEQEVDSLEKFSSGYSPRVMKAFELFKMALSDRQQARGLAEKLLEEERDQ